jgi:acyl transferase domain-containing protein/thioesterase domain-containing protein
MTNEFLGNEIAIIGIACRLPGAPNPDKYWHNLRNGVESIRRFTDEELRDAGVSEKLIQHPNYVKAGAPLDGMDQFDPAFFNMRPREALIMDPQHRQFLACAWEALENGGVDPTRFDGAIGVFGGSGHNLYYPFNVLTNQSLVDSEGLFLLRHTGNDKDFLTTRVSYTFNLKGPSVNVQTACSTSLVALHMAIQSLNQMECDMALVGGVTLEMPHNRGYLYHENEILSPDGHCRAFDAASQGTVFGSGTGVVLVKRLNDAMADNDPIQAIVLGSAVNNDGVDKASYLAPSPEGQMMVVAEALEIADVAPESIGYIEAHGTGTPLGDPIEMQALTQAFRQRAQALRQSTDKTGFCAVGSAKTNIGHLDTAAGVAGLIKTVQALKHAEIPASLHFEQPNPMIDLEHSPFFVNNKLREWKQSDDFPRRAGVSSLGVGGTNAHVILQEAPVRAESDSPKRAISLFTLSAVTPAALAGNRLAIADHLKNNPGTNFADAAYTLQLGRKAFKQRQVIVGRDHESLIHALESTPRHSSVTRTAADTPPELTFMFPGGGAQYPNMGRDLYESEPVYQQAIDKCLELLDQPNFKEILFPEDAKFEPATEALKRPSNSLPAVFITEYALAMLWKSWGIEPHAMIGHSMGEYTAACLAEVMSLGDALAIVRLRGELFETLPAGGMVSVSMLEEEIVPLLNERLSIAVINNTEGCVVSGELEAIDELEDKLSRMGASFSRIQINVAAHSSMLEPILERFEEHMRSVSLSAPTIPFISNVTGTWITAEESTDPFYWVTHLRRPVRFADGLATLLEKENQILLEVGPGQTLMGLVRSHPAKMRHHTSAASMRHFKDTAADDQQIILSLGNLWACGVEIDWGQYYGSEKRNKIHLPTYAFDTQKFWLEPGRELFSAEPSATDSLTKVPNLDDWFYTTDWRNDRQRLSQPDPLPQENWLIFSDDIGLSELIRANLIGKRQTVVTVITGNRFEQINGQSYVIRPERRGDYSLLIQALTQQAMLPNRVLHMWTVYHAEGTYSSKKSYLKSQALGFNSLVNLTQAWGELDSETPLSMTVVTSGTQIIGHEDASCIEKTTLVGPCRVIPREYPQIKCQLIDVSPPPNTKSQSWFFRDDGKIGQTEIVRLTEQLMQELWANTSDPLLAYRDTGRWVAELSPCLPTDFQPTETPSRLRKKGIYLITGGLGGIGLTLAQYLAKEWQAKLILLSRTALPERHAWGSWLEKHSPNNRISRTIQNIKRMEAAGGEVLVLSANVTNSQQLKRSIAVAKKRFGPLNGVIHGAGVIDDDLIQLKDLAAADKVMQPKVLGTLNLMEATQAISLDFTLLFSSTSTVLAPQGQVDYVGANAFLNAFAEQQNKNKDSTVIALNWGVWQEVGMAAATGRGDMGSINGQDTGHPLLGTRVSESSQRVEFMADYRTDELWMLDQHRIRQGAALIPGTGYLEIAAAAIQATSKQKGTIHIRDLFFLSPLTVQDDTTQRVAITLEPHEFGGGYVFQVSGRQERQLIEHARGTVAFINEKPLAARLDMETIWARCQNEHVEYDALTQRTRQEKYLDFGHRWKNLRDVWLGDSESLAYLALPPQFAADAKALRLHPALLDLATTHGLPLLDGYAQDEGLYVPFSYHSLKSYASIPNCIFSHVRLKSQNNRSMPVFDVTLTSDKGDILVEIEGFSMKRVTHAEMLALQKSNDSTGQPAQNETWLQKTIRAGIRPEEGVEILKTVLSRKVPAQLFVSSIRLKALEQAIDANSTTIDTQEIDVERPNHLGSDYVEPTNEVEVALVTLWQDLIGVRPIGIEDDFFELGGHSLIAVRLFTRIRKLYDVDLSLATLFETPTIKQCAERLISELGIETGQSAATESADPQPISRQWSPVVQINAGKPNKIPFFCIHGAGGNVLNFQKLAQNVGSQQPFYGLQAQGVDGSLPALTSIEEMATLYLEAIRSVWPSGPFLLGGYSGGGVVAYEIAHKLQAAGEQVPLIVFMDSFHPRIESQRIPIGEHWRQMVQWGPSYVRERLKTKEEKKNEAKKTADALHWVANHPGQLVPLEFREPYIVHNFLNALRKYKPLQYTGRVVQFTASETWIVYQHVGADRGWADLIPNLELLTAPGDHDQLFLEPNVQVLGGQLQSLLGQIKIKDSPTPSHD